MGLERSRLLWFPLLVAGGVGVVFVLGPVFGLLLTGCLVSAAFLLGLEMGRPLPWPRVGEGLVMGFLYLFSLSPILSAFAFLLGLGTRTEEGGFSMDIPSGVAGNVYLAMFFVGPVVAILVAAPMIAWQRGGSRVRAYLRRTRWLHVVAISAGLASHLLIWAMPNRSTKDSLTLLVWLPSMALAVPLVFVLLALALFRLLLPRPRAVPVAVAPASEGTPTFQRRR